MGIKQLFAAGGQKVNRVIITVDEEEHEVYVGKLTVTQMDRMLQYMKAEDAAGMNTYLVQVGSLDDAEGHRAFGDTKADTDVIKAAPVQLVAAIAAEVLKFNTMTGPEDAVKN